MIFGNPLFWGQHIISQNPASQGKHTHAEKCSKCAGSMLKSIHVNNIDTPKQISWYCWWKNSCTTWDVKTPCKYWLFFYTTSTGQPDLFHQQYNMYNKHMPLFGIFSEHIMCSFEQNIPPKPGHNGDMWNSQKCPFVAIKGPLLKTQKTPGHPGPWNLTNTDTGKNEAIHIETGDIIFQQKSIICFLQISTFRFRRCEVRFEHKHFWKKWNYCIGCDDFVEKPAARLKSTYAVRVLGSDCSSPQGK